MLETYKLKPQEDTIIVRMQVWYPARVNIRH